MPGDPNPYPDEVVAAYVELRLRGIPQRDAALQVGIPQGRAATWDKRFSLPTSRHPDRRPDDCLLLGDVKCVGLGCCSTCACRHEAPAGDVGILLSALLPTG